MDSTRQNILKIAGEESSWSQKKLLLNLSTYLLLILILALLMRKPRCQETTFFSVLWSGLFLRWKNRMRSASKFTMITTISSLISMCTIVWLVSLSASTVRTKLTHLTTLCNTQRQTKIHLLWRKIIHLMLIALTLLNRRSEKWKTPNKESL